MTITAGVIDFLDRDSTYMRVTNRVQSKEPIEEKYELIRTFEFTSERKAMSVIVKNVATNKLYVFVKGADSSIIPKVTHMWGGQPKSSIVEGRSNHPPISDSEID